MTAGLAGFGGDYARVRTDCRLVGSRRHRRPAGRLLRRRRPDPRLPHLPGPRRPGHDEQPAVQGRGERPVAVRLHRPDPGGQGRPGHQRLPDQPQHQALRGRVGRVGAQPPDREQRRALQPRVRGRAHRRGAALLPREPGRARPGSPSGSIVAGFFAEVFDRLPADDLRPTSTRPWRPSSRRCWPMSVVERVGPLEDLAPRARPAGCEVGDQRDRARPHRRRRLRHRRPLQPPGHLALGGRGARRRAAPSSAGSTAAPSRW